jgi:predicted phosphodiesterase
MAPVAPSWQVRGVSRVGEQRASRVAVLADVHGNAIALAATSAEVVFAKPDLVVFVGDLTWGPLPEETWALVVTLRDSVGGRTLFVRGNAERALCELRNTPADCELTARERWMLAQHTASTLDAFEEFAEAAVVEIEGLGPTRFCHGSPRSDEELITPATPDERMRALLADVPERVLVSAHTHVQFDRIVVGVRSLNPGSIGMPYQGKPGAYWALLGPGVDLQRTAYDVDRAAARYEETTDPLAEAMVTTLLDPPTPKEVIAHAEALEFST